MQVIRTNLRNIYYSSSLSPPQRTRINNSAIAIIVPQSVYNADFRRLEVIFPAYVTKLLVRSMYVHIAKWAQIGR